ncbi:MAG: hypothetical protein WD043_10545 [Gemmatimonadales bacterium]
MPTPATGSDLARWVATWRDAAPALDAQKRSELAMLDTPLALQQLAAAFAHALASAPPLSTSGLVEQQRCFQLLRR